MEQGRGAEAFAREFHRKRRWQIVKTETGHRIRRVMGVLRSVVAWAILGLTLIITALTIVLMAMLKMKPIRVMLLMAGVGAVLGGVGLL